MRRTKIDGSEGCQTEVQHRLVAGRQSQTLAAKVEQFFNSKGNLTLGSHIYLSVSRNVYIKMGIIFFFQIYHLHLSRAERARCLLVPLSSAGSASPVQLLLFLLYFFWYFSWISAVRARFWGVLWLLTCNQ